MKKERMSNIELLRFVAMILVLIVHANFFALGSPTQQDVLTNPASSLARMVFQSFAIVCVNVFVLISGWFGIHPSVRGFSNFIFQCLFFLCGIYFVMWGVGLIPLTLKGLAGCLVLLNWNWFIKAYIGLYILAPVLNAFVENSDRKTHLYVLLSFFAFQTIYSWVSNGAVFFESGYSTMSFIGLYLLARYINVYKPRILFYPPHYYAWMYLLITIVMSSISFLSVKYGHGILSGKMYSYVNPLVIMSAMMLLLWFKGLEIKSKFINWCAASSFAIFLLHTNPNICEQYYTPMVRKLYSTYNGVECIFAILGFIILVAVLAILIDQIRKLIWNKLIIRLLGR